MNDQFNFLQWLSTQSDRVWFLVAVVVLVWTFIKRQKQSDNDLKETRAVNHERNNEMMKQILDNCAQVTKICAESTVALNNNTEVLMRIRDKI